MRVSYEAALYVRDRIEKALREEYSFEAMGKRFEVRVVSPRELPGPEGPYEIVPLTIQVMFPNWFSEHTQCRVAFNISFDPLALDRHRNDKYIEYMLEGCVRDMWRLKPE